MPLAQLYQFAHCSMLAAGAITRWRNRMPAEQSDYDAALARLRQREREKTRQQSAGTPPPQK